MRSDFPPFMNNLFFYYYDDKRVSKTKKKTLKQPKNLKVFSDDLAVINDGGKFEPGKHSP